MNASPPPPPDRSQQPLVFVAVGLVALVAIVLTLHFTGVFAAGGDSSSDPRPSASSGEQRSPGFASPTEQGMGPAPVAPLAVPCPWVVPEAEFASTPSADPNAVTNRLAIGPQRSLTWNGVQVEPVTLRQYLDLTTVMQPRPLLVTRLDPAADPALVDTIRAVIDRGVGCEGARL